MAEPTSTGIGALLVSKLAGGLAGLLGGLGISFFWVPQSISRHGKLAAGAIIGGMSVGGALTCGGLVARWFGLSPVDIDVAMGIGFLVGASSVFVLSVLANYFSRHERDDLVSIAKDVGVIHERD